MKCKISIDISEPYIKKLNEWKNYVVWSGQLSSKAKYNTYTFFEDTPEFKAFLEKINSINAVIDMIRKEYIFSKNDIQKADFYQFIIDNTADAEEYLNYQPRICSGCNKVLLFEDKFNNVCINPKLIKNFDILETNPSPQGGADVIISKKLREIFENEKIDNIIYSPIRDITDEGYGIIDNFYLMSLPIGIGNVVRPTEINAIKLCTHCNKHEEFTLKSPLYFDSSEWKGYDLFCTKNYFGGPSPYMYQIKICSKRIYNIIKQNDIKGISFEPCFLK